MASAASGFLLGDGAMASAALGDDAMASAASGAASGASGFLLGELRTWSEERERLTVVGVL